MPNCTLCREPIDMKDRDSWQREDSAGYYIYFHEKCINEDIMDCRELDD